MKQGWEYKKIGEICKTYSGGTPLKDIKEYYENGNIPWLRSGEICRQYISETEMFITQEGLKNSSAKYYPKDTVVVAMYGATATQVGILKIEATSNQAVCGILPNNKFIPEFLYYFFLYRKEYLASQAQGGAQPNISQIKIKNLIVPVPPLPEQQSIVARLDSAFAKIDALKANAQKQLDEAKALFQSTLKQLLEPKEGWEEKRFSELFKLKSGDNLTLSQLDNGEYPVYGGNGINGYYSKYNLDAENILIGRVGALCGNVHITMGKIWITDNAFQLFYDNNKWDLKFLFYDLVYLDLNKYASQTAQPVISNKSLKDIVVHFPKSLDEQKSIVEKLDAISSRCRQLEENYTKTIALCDDMKQALLRETFE